MKKAMKIKVINRSAYALPQYETAGAAGMDVRADIRESIVLGPLERTLVPTGLYVEIPDGYEIQVRPRSGLAARHGISLVNSPGTIDPDYRGEIKAILVNLTDEHEPASLLSAEQVKRNADGSLTVQAGDGGLTLNIARNASVTPFGTKNKAKLEDIRMGTRFFAWYDTILESYPAQAGTDKVVLLPSEDDTFAIVIEGDIAIGEGRMTNGVAMVPLRLTAELCGFTVKWNAKDRTVHLTNGTVQTTVTIGQDEYFRATALPDADGMSRPGALGAAPYIAQSRTWVPAELFGLLGEQIEMRGDALYLGGVPNAFTGEADETNAFNIVCKGKTLDKGRMENGVAMVPLREVGEVLGYTVTWDIENRQAKMNNGKVMTHINIGEDSYIRSVMNGDGTEAPVSFGAAPYFADGKTWVPAKLFELLGEQVEMKGNALYLGGTEN